jgi:sarcosine oxidase subunit beta
MKVIVCRCEDVTLDDVRHSIAIGYADLEEVKRYTGFGTGPCQGKECMIHVARLCAEAAAETASHRPVRPFTARPPLAATPLSVFAADASDHDAPGDGEDPR